MLPLDDAAWSTLEHAYGKASDTPRHLAVLATGGEPAEDALIELSGSIFHQSTVYSATVAAWPYLVRVAADGEQDELLRARLLVNMAAMATVASAGDTDRVGETGVSPMDARSLVAPMVPALVEWMAQGESLLIAGLAFLGQWPEAAGPHTDEVERLAQTADREGVAWMADVVTALVENDQDGLAAAMEDLCETIEEAGDRTDDAASPRQAAQMALEDAAIALL